MTKDLNRLSAEVVMGWHIASVHREVETDGVQPSYEIKYWADDKGRCLYEELGFWHPLTDLNQCFQVVEELEKERAEVIIQKRQTQIFYNGSWHRASGKSRAENTLTAALKAKGVCLEEV